MRIKPNLLRGCYWFIIFNPHCMYLLVVELYKTKDSPCVPNNYSNLAPKNFQLSKPIAVLHQYGS